MNAKKRFVDEMGGIGPTITIIAGIIMAVTFISLLAMSVVAHVAPELASSLLNMNLHIAVAVIHVVSQLVFFGDLFYHEEFYSLAGRSYRKRVGLVDIKEMGL